MIRVVVIVSIIGLHVLPTLATESEADGQTVLPRLNHNPFKRPAPPDPSSSRSGTPDFEVPSSWSPSLRATVVASSQSVANVDGNVLLIGEEIDGFRLIEVGEGIAVFERDGKRRVLTMD